ncbi:hypothetical protein DV737_g1610, partial [Chaetothyriales sp. CBS 132003]
MVMNLQACYWQLADDSKGDTKSDNQANDDMAQTEATFVRSFVGAAKAAFSSAGPVRDFARFAEGDRVLINDVKLLDPLKQGKTTEWKHGHISHDSIIGAPARRFKILSSRGVALTVNHPTLEQFVSLSPRHVTPIYGQYAAFIVNQLDVHVSPPGSASSPLEILDAGTGHGSLTMHLARAIAAANSPPPALPHPRMPQANLASTTTQDEAALADVWKQWKETRNAVIHTVEAQDVWGRAAERLIRSFRQGLYWPHIDFNIGNVDEWVGQKLAERGQAFLSAVVLDLPDVHLHFPQVLAAMEEDARLVIYTASITQLCECEKLVEARGLPLKQEKVVELGSGISDGRIWNVRVTVPRARSRPAASPSTLSSASPDDGGPEKVMICRPKVFERVVGGGFIGIWRKTSPVSRPAEDPDGGKLSTAQDCVEFEPAERGDGDKEPEVSSR